MKSHIKIVDARVRGKQTGYRVKSIAANGKTLQVSEVLNDRGAVKRNIVAMYKTYVLHYSGSPSWSLVVERLTIKDETKGKKFI